jgi:drug/metabolite transporter (DMT)-like permease
MIPVYFLENYFSEIPSVLFHSNHDQLMSFLLWTAVIGLGSSWIATLLWNKASQSLPTSLTGQLIVSETVFSLLYGFFYEKRLPAIWESISIVLIILGVFLSIRSFKEPKTNV